MKRVTFRAHALRQTMVINVVNDNHENDRFCLFDGGLFSIPNCAAMALECV